MSPAHQKLPLPLRAAMSAGICAAQRDAWMEKSRRPIGPLDRRLLVGFARNQHRYMMAFLKIAKETSK